MDNISERSKSWLFWYGFGKAAGIAFTIIATYFAYKLFDNSNSAKLANELNSSIEKTISQNNQIDSLNNVLNIYTSKRFMIHKEETKVLFSDVFFYFSGTSRNDYSIYQFNKRIISTVRLPSAIPDTFTVDNQKYFIVAERLFINGAFEADSALIYWDSLKTESIK
jgi:hypothetical protein